MVNQIQHSDIPEAADTNTELDLSTELTEEATESNDNKPATIIKKIRDTAELRRLGYLAPDFFDSITKKNSPLLYEMYVRGRKEE